MSRIELLDVNTINKIAAGEVIERPASVVKELVENSIDAGATAITIEIKDGGLKLVRITDNGDGISPEDISNAFVRHSTSKIKSIEDLLTVSSLGFRGEALASIAAVSEIELITKVFDNITGIRYQIDGGVEKSNEEVGCPDGTTFIVNNLFYNTPARRKFLKSPNTEAGYISELINKLALGNPHISFKFISNGQLKLHTSGNTSLKDCIFKVFGKDIATNLIEINYSENFSIKGFIGKPQISRANRNYENYYINGRYIKSKLVMKAIEDAYKTNLTVHRYPFVNFNICIDPNYIDVNVHPTKMDIRFNNEEEVYNAIYNSIINGFNKSELIPEVTFDKKAHNKITNNIKESPEPFEVKRRDIENRINNANNDKITNSIISHNKKDNENNKDKEIPIFRDNIKKEITDNNLANIDKKNENGANNILSGNQIDYNSKLFTSKGSVKEHKIAGKLFDTYWIVEFKDKYYIIDQHAAHERVLYERIIKSLENKEKFSQTLIQPLVINLSMSEKVRLSKHMKLFEDLGFELEDFGGDSIAIRSVPYIFNKNINGDEFLNIIDKLDDEYKENKYEILLEDIAEMACKAAVKGRDKLSDIEYQKLIDELISLDNPFNCPHGRPTIISMTKYELEKKFKRIQ